MRLRRGSTSKAGAGRGWTRDGRRTCDRARRGGWFRHSLLAATNSLLGRINSLLGSSREFPISHLVNHCGHWDFPCVGIGDLRPKGQFRRNSLQISLFAGNLHTFNTPQRLTPEVRVMGRVGARETAVATAGPGRIDTGIPALGAPVSARAKYDFKIGGLAENRTRVHGFAVRCVTTPPPGRAAIKACRPRAKARWLTEAPARGNPMRPTYASWPIALRLRAAL